MVGPSASQMALKHVMRDGHSFQRRACRLLRVARSTARYEQAPRVGDEALLKRIKQLAHRHRRYGYRRVTVMLRREGMFVNVKWVHRLSNLLE